MGDASKSARKKRGYLFLGVWFVLIWAGIFDKEILGHADLMVFFHLPAAVFLVLGAYDLSYEVRLKYRESLRRYQNLS